ncbi:DapH/DapD/GlmU-related protein [Proteus faecis]|uniref:DapH/DapD/GlmU-related protein n=1 Tax=Proteus faecis TaxID=2050967 RepID=UPI003075B055
MNNYTFYTFISTLISYIYTKLFFKKSKLIRYPISIRGKKYINFGSNLVTGKYCRIDAFGKEKNITILSFGDNCQLNDSVHIGAIDNIKIGNNVLIASRVFITDHQHGNYNGEKHSHPLEIAKERKLSSMPVTINDNVWIGEGVAVLPGVTIGKNSIIGANAVVTQSVPENCIAVGIPAKVIKKFNFKKNCWQKVPLENESENNESQN